MKHKLWSSLLLFALTLCSAALASSTWYVDGVNGSDNNNCKSTKTACKTIGHAISLASSGDSIMVAAATYTENLTIGFSLKVIGAGANTTIIDGRQMNTVVRIFSGSSHVSLLNVTIRNGKARNGGGVLNSGALTIDNSILSGNLAQYCVIRKCYSGAGGGIYSTGGTMTINHSTFNGNSAGYGGGGGIVNDGTLMVNNSTFSGNSAGAGGAVYNVAGTMTIKNSTISKNSAGSAGGLRAGGGIDNYGTLTINHSTFSGNVAGDGGGIANDGKLMVNNSTFSGNVAPYGGGIENYGTLTINNSTFSGNQGSQGLGGGLYNGSTLTVNNSTFSGNGAGFEGGGIYISNGAMLTISNSTLSQNDAGYSGGNLYNGGGTAIPQNTIVANSSSGGNCNGTMTSNGYNLSSDGTCSFNGPGDLNNTDPKLGRLGNYGGPTQTIPLLAGSPAIDAGNPNGCTDGLGHLLKTDQRGKPRPDKEDTGGCDMGAYERQKD